MTAPERFSSVRALRPKNKTRGYPASGAIMKIVNSLKTMKTRHKACRLVRRKGRVYVINKSNPRFKARQG